MFPDNEADLFRTSVLMHDCKFDFLWFVILEFERFIENKAKLEVLVHRSNSHIKAHPIFLSDLNKML